MEDTRTNILGSRLINKKDLSQFFSIWNRSTKIYLFKILPVDLTLKIQ